MWPTVARQPRLFHIASNNITNQRQWLSTAEKIATDRARIDRIIRVDHAGEYGADRIYAGQLAILGKSDVGPTIQHMWDQEKHHLATFEAYIPKYRARPSALLPLWHVAGYAVGAGTALLGKEAAMACTVAVEASITEHYNQQIRELSKEDGGKQHEELINTIAKFRDEEQEHHDTGLEHGAELAPAYALLSGVIKAGCKGAIWAAERF